MILNYFRLILFDLFVKCSLACLVSDKLPVDDQFSFLNMSCQSSFHFKKPGCGLSNDI